jgi:lipopolysaccharide transport system ATP-binding protein
LEQEILVVDEVLAVGDAEFQKKCLGKMQNVAKGGRTVLFVSHNMASVLNLCETGILLEQGRVSYQGSMREVATRYARVAENSATNSFQPAEGKPSITSVRLNPQAVANGDLEVEIGFRSPFPLKPPVPGFLITSAAGIPVFGSNARFHGDGFNGLSSAGGVLRFVTQRLPLVSGSYRISVWLGDWYTDYDQKLDVLDFDFRPDCTMALRPPPELIGFLDWPGAWRITG